jgi:hypothetical protein
MNFLLTSIGLAVTFVSTIVLATWSLSTKMSALKADVLAEIGTLKTDIAVLKKSEESRDEKINRMWNWWMTALENGWIGHMKNLDMRKTD